MRIRPTKTRNYELNIRVFIEQRYYQTLQIKKPTQNDKNEIMEHCNFYKGNKNPVCNTTHIQEKVRHTFLSTFILAENEPFFISGKIIRYNQKNKQKVVSKTIG